MSAAKTTTFFIYITAKDKDEARKIGKALVEQRLAACVNILDNMNSLYWWEGRVQDAREAVLIAKTSNAAAPRVREVLAREHPYEVPAILTLALADVNAPYRDWLMQGIA